ncbi:LLM class flavin-dependent oxidoreductase [Ktedonosporobacter rubrisoli]|uniref:LLM class flavin-dependent oxidoreductase n=1 Tax=Ktedonosporobacter rubrisoli TaxID=2509675 RepID=A0A4V0YZN9_KTERU|nr:LLM class flavin-dependent oxidoreductase [Ktedonosporobacter rubrisoli]QBD80381.1 LLM class flavin-dependent oxidoreductase [Ktedonosporobacter rubrisoli]
MKIGIGIPQFEHPEQLFTWARRIDAGPFSSLGIYDRLVYSNYEPLITLAMAAAVTTRVRLMTEVLLAPLRTTSILAKECATLDAFAQGRLTLGLSVGIREDDFLAAEVEYKKRGKRFDEQLIQLKRLWSGQALNEQVGPIGPRPHQAGGPELILGGDSPAAIARAASLADGHLNGNDSAAHAAQAFRAVEKAWQEAGRAGKPRLIGQVNMALETQDSEQARQAVYDYYSIFGPFADYKARDMLTSRQQARDAIAAFRDIGADELMFYSWSSDPEQIERLIECIG